MFFCNYVGELQRQKVFHFDVISLQTVLLNTLTSEYVIIDNPLQNEESVQGVFLLNAHLFIHGQRSWCRFNMRGELQERYNSPERLPLLQMEFTTLEEYRLIFWSGDLNEEDMLLHTTTETTKLEPLNFHRQLLYFVIK